MSGSPCVNCSWEVAVRKAYLELSLDIACIEALLDEFEDDDNREQLLDDLRIAQAKHAMLGKVQLAVFDELES